MKLLTLSVLAGLSIVAAGCPYNDRSEPDTWEKARQKIRADDETMPDTAELDATFDAVVKTLEGATQVLGGVNVSADACGQHAQSWPDAMPDADYDANVAPTEARFERFARSTAFFPATFLYSSLRQRYDLIRGAIFDPAQREQLDQDFDDAELALDLYAAAILAGKVPTDEIPGKEFAADIERNRAQLDAVMKQNEEAALDDLLALVKINDRVLAARAACREAHQALVATLDLAASDPKFCLSLQDPGLQQALDDVTAKFSTLSNSSKTRHEMAKNSIRNVR